jgi:hypothetical protein
VLFAEIDMDFHASKRRPDFPFGPLEAGDMLTVKFFVTYLIRGGRIVELKSMTWPPGRGVSRIPRLGPHPSQIAAFESYVAAFSNGDCERFPLFYTDDVVLELPSVPAIHGARGIADFYRPMFERVRESLTIHRIEASEEAIHLDATTRFTAIRDAPDFVVGALREGDYIEGRVLVDYTLREGLIARISVRRKGDMIRHPRDDRAKSGRSGARRSDRASTEGRDLDQLTGFARIEADPVDIVPMADGAFDRPGRRERRL